MVDKQLKRVYNIGVGINPPYTQIKNNLKEKENLLWKSELNI